MKIPAGARFNSYVRAKFRLLGNARYWLCVFTAKHGFDAEAFHTVPFVVLAVTINSAFV